MSAAADLSGALPQQELLPQELRPQALLLLNGLVLGWLVAALV